jgi:hypothetical protein
MSILMSVVSTFAALSGGDSIDCEVEYLRTFAKLYGYIRYFHPSDEASQIDWDQFAIYGVQEVCKIQSPGELRPTLKRLFLPIAPTVQIYASNQKPRMRTLPSDTSGLKIVAWQHSGVYLNNPQSNYRSIRTNRENRFPLGIGLGTIVQEKDALSFRGKQVKVTASVRAEVTGLGNQGQLWLRVDRKDRRLGFFDNMDDRPITAGDWNSFEILGSVDTDAVNIAFGCFLKGTGQLWIDNFKLSVKNERGQWEDVPLSNPGFEQDSTKPAHWAANGRGYAFSVVDQSPASGKKCLKIENSEEIIRDPLFDAVPPSNYTCDKYLGSNLSCQFPLTLWSDEHGTLEKGDLTALSQLKNEIAYINKKEVTANDKFVRLATIVIAWNVFQHFYPYFDVVGTDWDSELTNFLRKAIEDHNENEFIRTLEQLVVKLHDGHGQLIHRRSYNETRFPLIADWIENHMVVMFSEDTTKFKHGDFIEAIDGIPAKRFLDSIETTVSGSPQWKRAFASRGLGFGPKGTTAIFSLVRSGKHMIIEASRNNSGWLKEPRRSTLKEIEPGVFYVDLDEATMALIDSNMHALANAKGVIFDLRGYPKGNHDVIRHLLTMPDTSGMWMRIPKTLYPDRHGVTYENRGWFMKPREPHIQGKVVFLTDGSAISYAESFMSFIKHYKLAVIVGQPTAGANGNVNFLKLPAGFQINFTGMKVVQHDGSQHHLIGIQPTVTVRRTLQGILAGRDEFLEKALEIIHGEK